MNSLKNRLRIIHTNDLHSEFERWPAVVAMINSRREEAINNGEEVLLFDIGDHADRAHPMTDALRGKGNVQLMNELHYDGVTIGNNEGMTFSKEELNRLYEDANFPVILCNLYDETNEIPDWAIPYKVITMKDQLKIGIIGVTAPFQLFYEPLGWKIVDPIYALKKYVEKLRLEVDIFICLSHLGLFEDERLAEEIPLFDFIIGAHTHHVLEKGRQIGNTWINQSGRSGRYIGEILIDWEKNSNKQATFHTSRVTSLRVDEAMKDEETEKKINTLSEKANEHMMKRVVTLKEPLTIDWYGESPIVKILAEALREWCDAEISMVNAGVILDSLQKGEVTYKDIHRICPHPINPAKVQVTGKKLLEIIRQSQTKKMIDYPLKGFGFRGKILGKMVFDGVTIKSRTTYIKEEDIFIHGKPLEKHTTYQLATLDMFTFGHLYPAISGLKDTQYFMPEFLRDVLSWKLKKELKNSTRND